MKKTKSHEDSRVDELKSQLYRALADYDNLKKRVEKDLSEFEGFANIRLIKSLLPVFDMLESVQKHTKDSGLAIAMGELETTLAKENIYPIKPKKGDNFNEHLHEATEIVEDGKKGTIMETILTGWRAGDRVIRPAKVKVTK